MEFWEPKPMYIAWFLDIWVGDWVYYSNIIKILS